MLSCLDVADPFRVQIPQSIAVEVRKRISANCCTHRSFPHGAYAKAARRPQSVRSRTLDGACPLSRCARDRRNLYRATIIPGCLQQGRRGFPLLSATFFEPNAERFQSDVQRTGIREVVVKAGRLKLRLCIERGKTRPDRTRSTGTPSRRASFALTCMRVTCMTSRGDIREVAKASPRAVPGCDDNQTSLEGLDQGLQLRSK
jgi:hypothetical protein